MFSKYSLKSFRRFLSVEKNSPYGPSPSAQLTGSSGLSEKKPIEYSIDPNLVMDEDNRYHSSFPNLHQDEWQSPHGLLNIEPLVHSMEVNRAKFRHRFYPHRHFAEFLGGSGIPIYEGTASETDQVKAGTRSYQPSEGSPRVRGRPRGIGGGRSKSRTFRDGSGIPIYEGTASETDQVKMGTRSYQPDSEVYFQDQDRHPSEEEEIRSLLQETDYEMEFDNAPITVEDLEEANPSGLPSDHLRIPHVSLAGSNIHAGTVPEEFTHKKDYVEHPALHRWGKHSFAEKFEDMMGGDSTIEYQKPSSKK